MLNPFAQWFHVTPNGGSDRRSRWLLRCSSTLSSQRARGLGDGDVHGTSTARGLGTLDGLVSLVRLNELVSLARLNDVQLLPS